MQEQLEEVKAQLKQGKIFDEAPPFNYLEVQKNYQNGSKFNYVHQKIIYLKSKMVNM